MAYPAYLRERARELRTEKHLSLDEIAERLALPKTTVWYWIAHLPLGRLRREDGHPGNVAMQAKYRRLREAAYRQGRAEYDELMTLPTFRDFVVLYIAEGYKRNRKSNSGQLDGRSWRSEHGVLTVRINDTLLRARLQAWIDRIREDWALDSAALPGV